MASHVQVEYDLSQASNLPITALSTNGRKLMRIISSREVSLGPQNFYKVEGSHVRNDTNTQWPLPLGLTSPALGNGAPPKHFLGRFKAEHYSTAITSSRLPFKHDVPSVVPPTPISQQKWEIQLAEQGPFDLTFSLPNFEPHLHIVGPLLSRVPCEPVPDAERMTGVIDPPPHFNPSIHYTAFETQTLNTKFHPCVHATPSFKEFPQAPYTEPPAPNDCIEFTRPIFSAGHNIERLPLVLKDRYYDRPGRKPAADFEPNQIKLHNKICRAHGGSNFATNWVLTAFKYGVNKDALHRSLEPRETNAMNFPGGFKPRHVYDGFIVKIKDRYECGLCQKDKKTYWKAKKDAVRHLRKFHFGLADACKVCGKNLYCQSEIKSHPCKAITTNNSPINKVEQLSDDV